MAAGRLQITLTTARTHLAHIFEKTGTRRRAEVVPLILQSAGGIGQ
jgi:DNA-binding CsgD family transcriptional regulator